MSCVPVYSPFIFLTRPDHVPSAEIVLSFFVSVLEQILCNSFPSPLASEKTKHQTRPIPEVGVSFLSMRYMTQVPRFCNLDS